MLAPELVSTYIVSNYYSYVALKQQKNKDKKLFIRT